MVKRLNASAPHEQPLSPSPRSLQREVTWLKSKSLMRVPLNRWYQHSAPNLQRNVGNKPTLNFGTAGSLRERIKDGENADLVVLSESAIAELVKLGLVVADTVVDLGRTVTGVVVREGGSVPDISTPEAFKQAPLNARSVAYTDPKAGGSGGIMFSALLEKHGIAEAINKKAVLGKSGHDVTTSSLKAAQRSGQRLSVRFCL